LGGNFEKAIDYSIAAGEEARVVFAHEETVRHWQLAAEMMEKMSYPAARQANLLEQLGYTEELAQSSLVTAVAHLVRAIKLYEECGDNRAAARVHARLGLDLSERYFSGYDIPAALIHYKRAETILKHDSENLDLARLYVSMAKTANYLMAYEDGLEWSNRAMEIAQRLKSDEVWAWAAAQHGENLHFLGRQRESLDILSRASEVAQKINSPHTGSRVAVLFGDYFWNLWDPRRAQECYLAELAKQQLVKQSHLRRNFEIALGENYIFSGDLERAQDAELHHAFPVSLR
jgi:tetratricopeptide (TPR) repeat protein